VTENDEPCMCGTDFTCMADEHECTCDGHQQFVCHDIRNEPHVFGCPRWRTSKKVVRIHMTYPDGTHTTDCKGCQP
jgi:hypothetical protein